jgi:hypothetical protein
LVQWFFGQNKCDNAQRGRPRGGSVSSIVIISKELAMKGKRTTLFALLFAALFAMSAVPPAHAQAAISEQEAHAIGIDAYLYFYPLISMDVTRKHFTNIEPGKEFGRGPMNTFSSMPAYPTASDKGVVRYNFDTLYSAAWLDMTDDCLGAGYRWPLLSPPNAGHVDGRVCLTGLADYRHSCRQLLADAAWLERDRAFRNDADRRANTNHLDHRPNED